MVGGQATKAAVGDKKDTNTEEKEDVNLKTEPPAAATKQPLTTRARSIGTIKTRVKDEANPGPATKSLNFNSNTTQQKQPTNGTTVTVTKAKAPPNHNLKKNQNVPGPKSGLHPDTAVIDAATLSSLLDRTKEDDDLDILKSIGVSGNTRPPKPAATAKAAPSSNLKLPPPAPATASR